MAENNQKPKIIEKPRKYTNYSLVIFLGLVLLGALAIALVYNLAFVNYYVDLNLYAFSAITVFGGYFTSVSLYYLGKLIFGKIAGFRLINFTFFFTRFVKSDNGIKVLPSSFEGLGCKLNMAPSKDNPNYKLYLFGGTIFSAPFFLIALVLFCVLDKTTQLKYYLLFIFSYIPFIIAGNLIPLRMDDYNEGFLLRLIKKEGVEKWYRNLHQLEALTNSSSTLQYYEISGDDLTPFDLDGLYYNYYYALDHDENTRCNNVCEALIYNVQNIVDLSKVYCGYAGKIYSYCKQKRFDEADRFLQEIKSEYRSTIKSKRRYESLKVSLYLDAYVESNYDDYLARYFSKEKLAKHYKYLTRVEKEEKLVEQTIANIQKDHPDWYVK